MGQEQAHVTVLQFSFHDPLHSHHISFVHLLLLLLFLTFS
jgi:hypothetical protein